MQLDPDFIQLVGPQLAAIAAMWLRIEHRITKLETTQAWMLAGRRRPPPPETPDAGGEPGAGGGAP